MIVLYDDTKKVTKASVFYRKHFFFGDTIYGLFDQKLMMK